MCGPGCFKEQSNHFSELLSHFRFRPAEDPLTHQGLKLLRCGGAALEEHSTSINQQ